MKGLYKKTLSAVDAFRCVVFIFIVHGYVLQRVLVNSIRHARKSSRLEPKESEIIAPATRGCTFTRIADWKRTC